MDSSADRLIRQIDDAQKNRARLTWLIYDELRRELGPARAEAVLARAIERRGAEVGEALFGRLTARTPETVADAFLAQSPADGVLFRHTRRATADGGVEIAVHRCPLKEAWVEAGLGDDDLATICRIAGRFDDGCFGAAGIGFAAETWRPGHAGCCTLRLTPR